MTNLFAKNLTFFDTISPDIAAAMRATAPDPALPDWPGAPPPARRFLFRPPSIKTATHHMLFDFAQELYAALDGEIIDQEPRAGAGYLFLFGCPQHIDIRAFLDETDVRGLVLCESNTAAFHATASTVDWTALAEAFEAKSGRIRFVLAEGAALLATLMKDAVNDRNYGLIDGSYYRIGRPDPNIESAFELFSGHLPNLVTSVGFFEDELKMIRNVAGNQPATMESGRLPVIARDAPVSPGLAAVVIGSGPSAEDTLATIKDCLDGVVVLTAGTGLGVALHHGIKPDFHCEIENVDELQEVITPIAEQHDLSGIPLIGPTTLSPHTLKFFTKKHFYIREGTCSSALYGNDPPLLRNAAPTVANVAARVAIALGAKTIILAGVDFGTTDPARHHADSSVYNIVEPDAIPASLAFAPFDLTVPGNRGTPVRSSQSFMVGAQAMGQLFNRYPNRRVFNPGDGARIDGTEPVSIADLAAFLSTARLPDGCALSMLDATLVEASYTGWPEFPEQWRQWRHDFSAALSGPSDIDFVSYYDRITKAVFRPDSDIRLVSLVYGTIMMMFQTGAYIALRMNSEQTPGFMTVFQALFQTCLDRIDCGVKETMNIK